MRKFHLIFQIKAQVILEFTFCFVILMLLIYGCVMAFRWAGASLAERRIAHDKVLTSANGMNENWQRGELYSKSPLNQLDTDFYDMSPMNLIFNNW